MNLLIYVPQMAAYGGMEQHVCLLAVLLAQKGHVVAMMTTSNSLNEASRAKLQAAGIQLRELSVARGNATKAGKLVWLLLNALLLRGKSWDVIYTNGQSGLARLVWLAGGSKTRIVHHHHTAGDSAEQRTWHPAFRRTLAASPELVACSDSTKRHLNATLNRVDTLFLSYLTPEMLPSIAVKEKSYSPESVLHFGFTGRLVSTKGIDTICNLSREPALGSVRWHIHGSGEGYPESFFEAFPNVSYHGPYNGPGECGDILQGLDALALFSRHNEGMPLSLIEGMAAGLPWIATDQGGTRELAVAAENCEVLPAQATFEEVTMRLLDLVGRIRHKQTSRVAQRRAYDDRFAPQIVAEHWLDFLIRPARSITV